MFRWCSMLFIVIVPAIHVRFGQRRVSTWCQWVWACKSLQNMFAPWQHELKNPCDRKTAHDCLANLGNSLCWTSKHLLITRAHPCTQTRSWNVSLLDHQANFLQQRKHVEPVSSCIISIRVSACFFPWVLEGSVSLCHCSSSDRKRNIDVSNTCCEWTFATML